MPNYVRRYVPGASVFVTIVTDGRRPLFAEKPNVDRLRNAMAAERAAHPFEIEAAVVLPDHLHLLMTLPPDDTDYSSRIGRIKAAFTKSLLADVSSFDRTSADSSRDERRERRLAASISGAHGP
jgi:putative transposase